MNRYLKLVASILLFTIGGLTAYGLPLVTINRNWYLGYMALTFLIAILWFIAFLLKDES